MGEISHTPGPWHVHKGYPGSGPWDRTSIDAGPEHSSTVIATVNTMIDGHEANGAALAAVPEMLAACRAIRKTFEQLLAISPLSAGGKPIDHRNLNEAGRLADIAIAKAEGR